MPTLLNLMIFTPLIGALLCLVAPSKQAAKSIALVVSVVTLAMSLVLAAQYDYHAGGVQFESAMMWIKGINVEYRTGMDGLSLPLIVLTTALSVLVVAASWNIEKMTKAFMALYLFLYTGMLGVFLSLDMVLFYVFFEVSLLPMYFLIGIWGGPRKEYAAIKFFLYTLAGSICLLVVMLGLYHITPNAADSGGKPIWNMMTLQSDSVHALFAKGGTYWVFAQWAFWLTLVAFLIKLPAVPFHTWLPDAHVEAPTPISMILAGVLLKMGGYAMMRITWPFFPDSARLFWVCVATLGVIAIIYGALCAMAQSDWKKLVAYSSVSHMGYVTLGLAVLTRTGFDGAYFQMIAHGITSAMMFFMVGVVYERAHHREIDRLGGIWLKWPGYGGWSLLCFFAGMGLPGLCGFIGEIMVLLGTFEAVGHGAGHTTIVYTLGVLAAFGVVLTAGYILWMFQRVYMGLPKPDYDHYEPVNTREYAIMTVLGVLALVFGIVPMIVFHATGVTFNHLFAMLAVQ
ncbi:MAG: NADH-quinone oxidoreductase subunit M [Phycisphaera sp.]|nr:NADH-quinone oxidoreductase subunit M [Phycisphaera sp.]